MEQQQQQEQDKWVVSKGGVGIILQMELGSEEVSLADIWGKDHFRQREWSVQSQENAQHI